MYISLHTDIQFSLISWLEHINTCMHDYRILACGIKYDRTERHFSMCLRLLYVFCNVGTNIAQCLLNTLDHRSQIMKFLLYFLKENKRTYKGFSKVKVKVKVKLLLCFF